MKERLVNFEVSSNEINYDIIDSQTGQYIKTDCKLIAFIPAGTVLTNEEIREYYGIDQDHADYKRARRSRISRLVFNRCVIPDSSFYRIEKSDKQRKEDEEK